jgi:D-glycero-alpha-D-manno-heptose-7-phosphate kinase
MRGIRLARALIRLDDTPNAITAADRRHPGCVSETIITRAPTRIDFGGGWTDVPPYSDEMGGFVCNVAIARYATVTVEQPAAASRDVTSAVSTTGTTPDRSIAEAAARRFGMIDARIDVRSDFPLGAGLGGSSAAGVATVAALAAARGESMDPPQIAELSRAIEIGDLGVPGGRQDHYAAAFGGALGIRFSASGVDVRRIPLGTKLRTEIERRCIVVYTGKSRISGETIEAVLGAYRERDARVLAALDRMRATAESMAQALASGDIDALAELVAEQWTHQRSLHPAIPTPLIDQIIARGSAAGAAGAKALGASGGGCVLLIARQDRSDEVRRAVAAMGELLAFTVAEHGVERCR